ncbi:MULTISPECIES: thymidylate synthase [unclassified Paenibacillus]|uniref:thymidylate synthase n=1 Tax=unclassified Paenibacillus TaxID=185978 RepID=UPI00020D6BA6|nr:MULTISPECIES: thymidylate synthase [unclassified Paenibacillus]EGL17885.1 thymidylate synthase [Paenibacillus sp. HGF7]EPD81374.1 thymidylate synthase [Paenibacillus sp. HGH0039]
MNSVDKVYLALGRDILENGIDKTDRTGTGTRSVFGRQLRFDLNEGFPLLTTKRVHFRSVLGELLWFLSGSTNKFELSRNYGVTIWDEWGDDETGELGRVYGSQWRTWQAPNGQIIDQIAQVINQIKSSPDSRRHLISAWNVGELESMALPPCHYAFQFYVADGKLSCMFQMRSTDYFLGLPFNIPSYALLTMMVAQVCGLGLGELIYSGGDIHIYSNHFEQVNKQLIREPKSLPKVYLNSNIKNIDDFAMLDFILDDYNPHPGIKAPVAI